MQIYYVLHFLKPLAFYCGIFIFLNIFFFVKVLHDTCRGDGDPVPRCQLAFHGANWRTWSNSRRLNVIVPSWKPQGHLQATPKVMRRSLFLFCGDYQHPGLNGRSVGGFGGLIGFCISMIKGEKPELNWVACEWMCGPCRSWHGGVGACIDKEINNISLRAWLTSKTEVFWNSLKYWNIEVVDEGMWIWQ